MNDDRAGHLFDRADPATLCTWEEFERHHRDAFIERITRLAERMSVGS